jgi:hypothetical protein
MKDASASVADHPAGRGPDGRWLPNYEAKTARARVTNHNDLLPGVDGRSAGARRYRDLILEIVADQGGAEHLAQARVQLIRRFAAASVLAESLEAQLAAGKPIDIAEHAQLCSSLVRLAQRIGINRRLKNVTPDLRDYLETHTPEPGEAAHE